MSVFTDFLNRDIKLFGNQKQIIQEQKPQNKGIRTFAKTVPEYTQETYSQQFANYETIYGSQSVTFAVIDGLYESTIFNRLVNKIVSDAVPEVYTIQIVDLDGNSIPELEQLCRALHANVTRTSLRNIFRDALIYGSCVSYLNFENDILTEIFNLDIQKIEPQMGSDGTLEAWIDKRGATDITVPVDETVFTTWDPKTGELFGRSILGPVIHILHLFLNTELNLAEIVDKFVTPIIAWVIETDNEGITNQAITDLMNSIANQYEQGNDIVISSNVKPEIIGAAKNQFDLVPIFHQLKETLGIAFGIPFPILGGKADNLSSSTVQLKTYLAQIGDYQRMVSDALITGLYKPFLEKQGKIMGIDYLNIYLNFPIPSIDTPSEAIKWILPALREGLITRDEARAKLGLRGVPLPLSEIQIADSSSMNQSIADNSTKDGRGDPNVQE